MNDTVTASPAEYRRCAPPRTIWPTSVPRSRSTAAGDDEFIPAQVDRIIARHGPGRLTRPTAWQ